MSFWKASGQLESLFLCPANHIQQYSMCGGRGQGIAYRYIFSPPLISVIQHDGFNDDEHSHRLFYRCCFMESDDVLIAAFSVSFS